LQYYSEQQAVEECFYQQKEKYLYRNFTVKVSFIHHKQLIANNNTWFCHQRSW